MQSYNFSQQDIYRIDVSSRLITRITDLPNSDETSPVPTPDGKNLLFVSDKNGINNLYVKDLNGDSIKPLTNSLNGVYQLSLSHDGNKLAFASLTNGGFDIFLMRTPLEHNLKTAELEPVEYFKRSAAKLTETSIQIPPQKESLKDSGEVVIKHETADSTNLYGNEVKIDLRNYVFDDAFSGKSEKKFDTTKIAAVTDNIDEKGNYKINKYKLNFSPDIVYGNAGFNTYYGVQGSTVMAFSDMLGNHQIFLLTNLLFDLKNSDYALAYLYLPKRIDYGIQGFHSARFLVLEDGTPDGSLYRFRNYGVTGLASYPLNKFNRFEFSLSWFNISRENLDYTFIPSQHRSLILPSVSFIHDNSLWGLIAPANGRRYNISLMASPKTGNDALGFYTITADYRRYYRLGKNYTFAMRFAGGGSFGEDPQRFVIGGVDNWVNRQFENNRIPVENAEDFVFLTSGIPLRGYNYNARLGTKYGLMNAELRFPFFGYFAAGPIPVFLQSLSGILFLDVGGAWTHQTDFKAFDRDSSGSLYMKDLLSGTGYGIRMIFLGFLVKMDVAWSFNIKEFSAPKYYFSLGADF
jgi:hypothetical protein